MTAAPRVADIQTKRVGARSTASKQPHQVSSYQRHQLTDWRRGKVRTVVLLIGAALSLVMLRQITEQPRFRLGRV
jgi:uncharacterized membrane protein YfcA